MTLRNLLIAIVVAACVRDAAAQAPPQSIVPAAVQDSDLTVQLGPVGRMPLPAASAVPPNPTSPIVAGSALLLVDQAGYIYRWDGTAAVMIFGPSMSVPGARLVSGERLLNAAANAAGTKVYAILISSSVPRGIPQRRSPRDPDAWYLVYEFDFTGTILTNARPITALQVRTEGHTGGGLAVLEDGSLLFSVADQGDSYEDGRAYSQDPAVYLSKILRINVADGSTALVANGVRGAQRLVIHGSGAEARLSFVENGGWVAEELDSVLLTELLAEGTPLNFGYGRNPDGKAREGMIYIDPIGNSLERITAPEPGFVPPVTEFGREKKVGVGASGPVVSAQSFQRITALFGDLPSGEVYATTDPLATRGQPTFRVTLVDAQRRPTTLLALTPGSGRADPRFFNFPDGTAGVLLEPTGEFFRLTEIAATR